MSSTEKGISLSLDGHELTDVHIEQTYKGNFHLIANIDGTRRKFVISKNKEEYPFIESAG
ncbi:MAG: type II toxin-antitoxin system HipA family toxin, partial [Bacteroidales bacterium]|nr:type II toxin-antitoxin system HipA family toxin [Bacteroidales bacterium]